MKRVIYKYPIHVRACTIDLPTSDFKVVCVREQNNVPTIWIELTISDVNLPLYKPGELGVYIFGTGEEIPAIPDLIYAGTCFTGRNVWHVYTRK